MKPTQSHATHPKERRGPALVSLVRTVVRLVLSRAHGTPKERRIKRIHLDETKFAKEFEKKLWGGFSHYALQDLETLKRNGSGGVSGAAWALAAWYAAEGDFQK